MDRHSSSVIVRRQYGEIDAFFLAPDSPCLRAREFRILSLYAGT